MAVAKSDLEYKQAFHTNPTCNPYTGAKICYNGPTYKKLVHQFGVPPTTTTVQNYRAKPKPPTPQQLQQKQLVRDLYSVTNDQLLNIAQQHNIFVSSQHIDSNFAFMISTKLMCNKFSLTPRCALERLPYDMIKEMWQHLDYLSIGRLHQTNIFFANLIQDRYVVNITEKIRQSISTLSKTSTAFLLTRYVSYNSDTEVETMLAQPKLGSTLEKFDVLGKPLPNRPKYVVTYLYSKHTYPYSQGRYTQAKVKPLISLTGDQIALNPIDIEHDIQLIGDSWCFSQTFEKIEFD